MTRDGLKRRRSPAGALRTEGRKKKRRGHSKGPTQPATAGSLASATPAAVAKETAHQTAGSRREVDRQNEVSEVAATEMVEFSAFSLHDLFEQQARHLLDRADIDEEQKQSIMLAMSCPCCGAGGPSFTVKLKKR